MKYLNYILTAIIAIAIASCQFTEEITINKDGSGEFKFSMDMSQMISMSKNMGTNNDSIEKEYEVIDSTFFMKNLLEEHKDSLKNLSKEELRSLEAIKDLKMHMLIDEKKGKMMIDFIQDFDDISEIENMQNKINKAQELQKGKMKEGEDVQDHDITYSYKRKSFKRIVKMRTLSEEDQAKADEQIESFGSFLSGSEYKLIYHFPKKIKEISYKGAQFSEDRKTVTIVVDMDSLTKNPRLLDFDISF